MVVVTSQGDEECYNDMTGDHEHLARAGAIQKRAGVYQALSWATEEGREVTAW